MIGALIVALVASASFMLGIAAALHPETRPLIKDDGSARQHVNGALIVAGALFLLAVVVGVAWI